VKLESFGRRTTQIKLEKNEIVGERNTQRRCEPKDNEHEKENEKSKPQPYLRKPKNNLKFQLKFQLFL